MTGPAVLAFDTETTGVDFYHSSRPFYVSTCTDTGKVRCWEWPVDPLTRHVDAPPCELDDLEAYLHSAGRLVTHNGKFDVTALSSLRPSFGLHFPWDKLDDTLVMAHLLNSSAPKDLTSLTITWLGEKLGFDPTRLEVDLGTAVKEARRYCRSRLKNWAIARTGMPGLPSLTGDEPWKNDYWLPGAVHAHEGQAKLDEWYGGPCPWGTALGTYATADAELTLILRTVLLEQIERRRLGRLYAVRMKCLPMAYDMERRGVTFSMKRLAEKAAEYRDETAKAAAVCHTIAASYGHKLVLPKNGVNNNLRVMCFNHLNLEHLRAKKSKTDQPTLDKSAMEHYEITLFPKSRQYQFIKALGAKRKRDTALTYMAGYRRFARLCRTTDGRLVPGWHKLHPQLNPTGTGTLRWSCRNPNEQNISKKEDFNLRYCFGPEPGYEWWSMDAKGIEDRLPAYESGEQELIAIFENDKEPPYYGSNHLLRFHTIYPDIWEMEFDLLTSDLGSRDKAWAKVGPHCKKKYASTWYQYAKNGGFAVQYGAVEKPDGWGTADKAFHKQGAHRLLKARFSKFEALNQKCIRFANAHGYVETIPDRSVDPDRGYPLMCTRTEYGKILETVPLNYHIQGSAMWWTMKAQIRCEEVIAQWRRETGNQFDAYVAMQVHDELVFALPRAADPRVDPAASNLGRAKELARAMERGGDDFGYPTPVGIEYHPDTWSVGISF